MTLGVGSRLRGSPDELLDRFRLDVAPSRTAGVRHHLFRRK